MFKVEGKYNTAIVYSDSKDAKAIEQIKTLCDQDFVSGAMIRIMPDYHYGAGCTIGFTADLGDKIVPNLVGVDIGCLDSDTEFLTIKGWKKISEYNDGDLVLQYDKTTDSASFISPARYIVKNCDKFYHFKNSKGLDQVLSEEHKMLIWKWYKGKGYSVVDMNPKDFYKVSLDSGYYGFKASFNINQNGIDFSDNEIRLLVMIAADGCIRKKLEDKNRIELHFAKQRKVDGAINILNSLEISFKKYDATDGTTYIDFYTDKKIDKNLSVLWKANIRQLRVVADECILWDGYEGYRSFFSSTNKDFADVIQFAFSSINIRAGISITKPKNKEHSILYSVTPTRNNIVGVNVEPKIIESKDGRKYCFTVPSGYFIARRNGKIFITGNCGMLTVELGKQNIDLQNLDAVINSQVPSGFHSHKKIVTIMNKIEDLHCYNSIDKGDLYQRQIGTLGGGNHFIEVDEDNRGSRYLVIHSGSRNLGKMVADHYQNMAVEDCRGHDVYIEKRKYLIQSLKDVGRESEIFEALKRYDFEYQQKNPDYPKDLCFLTGLHKEMYLHDMRIVQNYACINRNIMAQIILRSMFGKILAQYKFFHTIHNYINFKDNIIRKGAVSSRVGEKFIVPINMRDGSLICVGKGNPEWNFSAPHGAGRTMSRGEARRSLGIDQFKESMNGIYSTSVMSETIDEAPMAYKSMDEIVKNIQETAEIEKIIKPIYNFKAH